jgi:replicative DNA helicase
MTCFTVDNDSHLFLMNDYIVTHNTRSMIADICTFACDTLYNPQTKTWEQNGTKEPSLFIATEQDIEEVQTMALAFISDVNEENIINGNYTDDEFERVIKASQILAESPLYLKQLPDFSLQDIESTIKYCIQEYKVKYVAFDYLHSSMKILSEVTSKAGVKGLREDNVLFMLSVKLKDICNQYGVFIITATQLNGNYVEASVFDQNLLRGAKSIADKVDLGMILLPVTKKDLEALQPVLQQGGFEAPSIKMSIYKNRRGRYKDILLWCKDRRGVCKIDPMFVTDYNYELMNIEDLKIKIKPNPASAF